MDSKTQQILRLYRLMPGAPRIPVQDHFEMVGDVEGNEHWEFCKAIVDTADEAAEPTIAKLWRK